MILRLYPYRIERVVTADTYQDENGDWVQGAVTYECNRECDLKEVTEKTITYDDGTTGESTYKIYLKHDYPVKFGDLVRVTLLDGSTREFSVKAKHRYQLQTRIWV